MKRTIAAAVLGGAALAAIAVALLVATSNSVDPTASRDPADSSPAQTSQPPEAETPPVLTLADVRTVSFSDVPEQNRMADCASYAVYQGLLPNPGNGQFDPYGLTDLATVVAALHSMSGEATPEYDGSFADVSAGDWYAGAALWAVQSGLLADRDDGSFGPGDQITRAQLAVLLHRFAAGEDGQTYDETLSAYADGGTVADYARLPLAWTLKNGLYSGMITGTIYPDLPVTRIQFSQVLVALDAFTGKEQIAVELADGIELVVAPSVSAANHEEIQEFVDATAAKYGAIGLQVAVVESGVVTDTYAYGWATRGSDPMTADHKMRVASLTKVAVGMAAMLLREQGVIDLDESIGTYWGFDVRNPAYPDDTVNIRSLLSHTSSIVIFGDDASRARDSVASRLQYGAFSNNQPGSIYSWGYNNYAFSVLGLTLEIASGKCLDEIMNEGLWQTMDIDAAFESGCIQGTDKLVTLYYNGGGVARSTDAQRGIGRPGGPGASGIFFAGGLTVSSRDMAKMIALLANDGRYEGVQLLSEESVALMESRYDYQLADGTYQALPLRSQDDIYGRERLYYHTGSAYGVYNVMSYDPATGDGVVVLSVGASAMRDDRGLYAVCGEISQHLYELLA